MKKTTRERLMAMVRYTPYGCWEWTGARIRGGYGRIKCGGKKQLAHRVSYEVFKEAIPDGLDTDHLCRNPCCINPDHLEAVTTAENCRRGLTGSYLAAKESAKTHCPQGHEYTPDNTVKGNGKRSCRTCRNERQRRWWAANGRAYNARRAERRKGNG